MANKITVVEAYQQITTIMTGLSAGNYTPDYAAARFNEISKHAKKSGLNISFPTVAELSERYNEKTLSFENSEEYEESYESSTC
jgi:hypothetical protein